MTFFIFQKGWPWEGLLVENVQPRPQWFVIQGPESKPFIDHRPLARFKRNAVGFMAETTRLRPFHEFRCEGTATMK